MNETDLHCGPIPDETREEAVIAAILSAASYDVAAGWRILARARATRLTAAMFWRRDLGALYALICWLSDRGSAVDAVSVAGALESAARGHVASVEKVYEGVIDPQWSARVRAHLHTLAATCVTFNRIEEDARAVIAADAARRRARKEAGRV